MKLIISLTLSLTLFGFTHNVSAQDFVDSYLELKDALVQSDASTATSSAQNLLKQLPDESAFAESVKEIASSEDIKVQRAAFKIVTKGMINLVKSNELDQTLFVQYCPMALKNTGGSWLSLSEEIRNPYFGDAMLKCGSVKEEINN
ncbi:MAG: DUF3347 domain-containing protein [Cyclobacteriaceae bacterium]